MARTPGGQAAVRSAGWCLVALVAGVAASPSLAQTTSLPPIKHWRFENPVRTLHVQDAPDLEHLFTAHRYTLPAVRGGATVPRIFLRRLVDDFSRVRPLATREALFIQTVLPLVMRANAEIAAQRALVKQIAAIEARGENIGTDKRAWLSALARHYRIESGDLDGLLRRVDTVPAALALAQAINESGWGTSRLARESNGLFGEHASAGSGRRAIPVTDTNISVAVFPSLLDGVLGYLTTINRNSAYTALRALRAKHRREGQHPDGYALAQGLRGYSERGEVYVRDLRRLIRAHKLDDYDDAKLATGDGTTLVQVSR